MQTWVWRAFVLVDYGKPDLSVNTVNMGRDVGTVSPDEAIDRAARLYRLLAETQKRRTSSVTDLRRYHRVLWLGTLPPDAAVTNAAYESTQGGCWLVMDRAQHTPAPKPPQELTRWIGAGKIQDWQGSPPPLLTKGLTELTIPLRYEAWRAQWTSWAKEQRSHAEAVVAYEELYAIHQDAHVLSERYELVLAVGYLTWRSGEELIRRHLVTTPASIELDVRTGRLSVGPSWEGTRLALEAGVLDGADSSGRAGRASAADLLAEAGDPFDEKVHEALEVLAHAHGPSARYLRQPTLHQDQREELRISHAPALILRERSRHAYAQAFATLEKAVRDTGHVPELIRPLVVGNSASPGDDGPSDVSTPDTETYFPAPSNREQRQIKEQLRQDRTVVVLGPPGTGKTHTIANLVTDLLAHGNRVLVTSPTSRALDGLYDKLPEQIQDLCVSMVGEDGQGWRDLEQSMRALSDRLARYDRRRARVERSRLRQKLVATHRARTEAPHRLGEHRENEALRPEQASDAPTGEKALPLLRSHHTAEPEVARYAVETPPADQLVPPEQFAELAERHVTQAQSTDKGYIRRSPQYRWLLDLSSEQRSVVDARLGMVEVMAPQIASVESPFDSAVPEAWSGRYQRWREQRDRTGTALDQIHAHLRLVGAHEVTGLASIDVEAAYRQFRGRSGLVDDHQDLFDQVRVDGLRLDGRSDLVEVLRAQLAAEVELGRAERELSLPSAGSVTSRLARLTDAHQTIRLIVTFGDALALLNDVAPTPFPWTHVALLKTREALRVVDLDERQARQGSSQPVVSYVLPWRSHVPFLPSVRRYVPLTNGTRRPTPRRSGSWNRYVRPTSCSPNWMPRGRRWRSWRPESKPSRATRCGRSTLPSSPRHGTGRYGRPVSAR